MTKKEFLQLSKRASLLGMSHEDAQKLTNASNGLQRWYEKECGDYNQAYSWAIERDEESGIPYCVSHHYKTGRMTKTRVRDMERSYTKKVEAIAEKYGLYFYLQTDPRGAAVYVSREPLTEYNYTRGIAF